MTFAHISPAPTGRAYDTRRRFEASRSVRSIVRQATAAVALAGALAIIIYGIPLTFVALGGLHH